MEGDITKCSRSIPEKVIYNFPAFCVRLRRTDLGQRGPYIWKVKVLLKPEGSRVGGLHPKMLPHHTCSPKKKKKKIKLQVYKLFTRPVRSFNLLQRLCTLRRGLTQLFSKPSKPVWASQAPHTHFVISLYRMRNPSRRIGVGCVPKQKSINILVKTL